MVRQKLKGMYRIERFAFSRRVFGAQNVKGDIRDGLYHGVCVCVWKVCVCVWVFVSELCVWMYVPGLSCVEDAYIPSESDRWQPERWPEDFRHTKYWFRRRKFLVFN